MAERMEAIGERLLVVAARRTRPPSSSPSSRPTSPGCSSPTSRSRPGSTFRGARRALGGDQAARDADQRPTTRSCASARTRGPSSGTARRSSAASRGSRRPTPRRTCSQGSRAARLARRAGAPAPSSRRAVGASRADRLAYQGSRPLDARKIWSSTALPSPAGSRKLGWARSRIRCGRIRAWTRPRAVERQLERDALLGRDRTRSGRTRSCRARTRSACPCRPPSRPPSGRGCR